VIGYMSVKKVNNSHIGGILVVNQSGLPIEFKYTDPVIPTQLQKILYGKSLVTYLHTEIIGKLLLKKLENKPSIVLVDDLELIQVGERVYFASQYASPTPENDHLEPDECIIPLHGQNAVRIVSGKRIEDNEMEELKKIAQDLDILEPFQRLQKALEYVCAS